MINMIFNSSLLYFSFQFLHIGCDEVFQLGLCDSCRKKTQKPKELFIEHVQKVAQYVRSKYHIQPIIWDDMLRNMNSKVKSLLQSPVFDELDLH